MTTATPPPRPDGSPAPAAGPGALGVAGIALVVAAAVGSLITTAPALETVPSTPLVPDDPGRAGSGSWSELQWNFVGPYGVDAPAAWGNLVAAGAPGGAGVTVAVLDTGLAYSSGDPSHPGSPDLAADQIVPGYDFVGDDPDPYDQNGHGTHVASTIAERTGNDYGLTGLAYGVRILPVRVLDNHGVGEPSAIAQGVRFAVDHGAQVINLSLSFARTPRPGAIENLADALSDAYDRGVLVVVGAGNRAQDSVAYPASAPHVIAVGATTDTGCLTNYSDYGRGLDLVAPGGGSDAYLADEPDCHPGRAGSRVFQVTRSIPPRLGFDTVGYAGTSMAAPHVAATAALVIASGVLGADPSPAAIEDRLEQTARDLGARGHDRLYGWGLVNADAATAPGPPRRP